jgi:hypothetical protein
VATVEKVVTEDQASKGTACTVRICIQLADQVQQVVAGGAEGQDQGGQDGGSLILINTREVDRNRACEVRFTSLVLRSTLGRVCQVFSSSQLYLRLVHRHLSSNQFVLVTLRE